jgi:hypothetical protein
VSSFVRAAVFFAVLTLIMTWPQARQLSSSAQNHQDVYFNMWRFGWVAHALTSSSSGLLDGNIFYPERRTLTFSDAMPIEAFVAAPLLWLHVPPVLVHNLLLLAGIVLSASGIYVLASRLTGSPLAGITAGIIFGFAPYRFEHYMHMELQWTVWMPWAFWALHRVLETGRLLDGVLVGVFTALQFLSSIYYGIFLITLLPLVTVLLLFGADSHVWRRTGLSLSAGALTGGLLLAPYALPYSATREHVGGRSPDQVFNFGARASSYTIATDTNFLYGERSARRGRPERRLFPGVLAVLLAVTGLLLRPPANESIAYLLGTVAAFEMSLGLRGYSYRFFYEHVPIFESLRAPARLGVFVLFFLAVLAAYGHAALEMMVRKRHALPMTVLIGLVLILEYWVAPLRLVDFPNSPPPLYGWLSQQPRGVVAEFPMPASDALPRQDPRYAYMSTFHWMPLVNGYSGYYPPSYLTFLDSVADFPDEKAITALRRRGVHYVIVHRWEYPHDEVSGLLSAVSANPALHQAGEYDDGGGPAVVFLLR